MIQQQTSLKVADNSGAKIVKCIKILGGAKKKYAVLGDFIVVSVKKLRNKLKKNSKVKKKEICKALIIKTKKQTKIKTGYIKVFLTNSVILLNKQANPIATRILTSIPHLLKKKGLQKIINLSLGVV